ncbi:hypothetical protein J3Q64DRAFT_1764097 [Phycomyces blakesleeanus]|uniref:Uncharacterized protein n=1 Tax=Phycomyces blakesleeanus TaxID=4837 RepID=A0ABR3APY1_PHYBL
MTRVYGIDCYVVLYIFRSNQWYYDSLVHTTICSTEVAIYLTGPCTFLSISFHFISFHLILLLLQRWTENLSFNRAGYKIVFLVYYFVDFCSFSNQTK